MNDMQEIRAMFSALNQQFTDMRVDYAKNRAEIKATLDPLAETVRLNEGRIARLESAVARTGGVLRVLVPLALTIASVVAAGVGTALAH